jgi:O-antigen/teichoic acid export membrane protein
VSPPRLKTNLTLLILGDAAGKLINFLAFSRLARILEPEGNCHLEFALAAIVVGTLLVEAGLGPFGARAVAREPSAAARVLGRIMALRGLILVIALVALGAVAALVGAAGGGARALLLISAGLMLLPKPALCEWLFQGRNEMGTVTATMILDPLVAFAGTVAFVHEPGHLVRVPFILAAATATVAAVQQLVARARGIRLDLRHGLESAGATLRESLPLGLSTLAWAIRFFSPMLALGSFAPGPEAGAFAASHRLAVSMHAVVWLYFFNLLPQWSKLAAAGDAGFGGSVRRSLGITAGLAALLVAAVASVAGLMTIPQLYGAKYDLSVRILRVIALVPALAWISGNFRFGLIARGALRAELGANAAGAAAAVLAFGALGSAVDAWSAAAVFCGAEVLTLLVAWWAWSRHGEHGSVSRPTTGPRSAPGTPR